VLNGVVVSVEEGLHVADVTRLFDRLYTVLHVHPTHQHMY
jgi:hypothetical protein